MSRCLMEKENERRFDFREEVSLALAIPDILIKLECSGKNILAMFQTFRVNLIVHAEATSFANHQSYRF